MSAAGVGGQPAGGPPPDSAGSAVATALDKLYDADSEVREACIAARLSKVMTLEHATFLRALLFAFGVALLRRSTCWASHAVARFML